MTQYTEQVTHISDMTLQQLSAKEAFVNDRIKQLEKEKIDLVTELVMIEAKKSEIIGE